MVGICSWAFAGSLRGKRPVTELACLAANAGFSAIEGIFHPKGYLATQPIDHSLAVPVSSLATLQLHRYHLTDPLPLHRARALETIHGMLDCANRWEIRSISLSPGPLYQGQPLPQFLEDINPEFQRVLEKAKKFNCQIALENLPGHSLELYAAMALALDYLGPEVGVCLDIGNALLDPPISRWIENFKSRITKLHLSDGCIHSQKFSPMLPGDGQVPWPEVCEVVKAARLKADTFVEAPLSIGIPEVNFLAEVMKATRRMWTC